MTSSQGIVSRTLSRALAGAAFLLAPSAVAIARDWPSSGFRGQATEQPPCSCRSSSGRAVEVGREVCLRTADGSKRARCVMVINNTSWQVGRESCEPDQELTN